MSLVNSVYFNAYISPDNLRPISQLTYVDHIYIAFTACTLDSLCLDELFK